METDILRDIQQNAILRQLKITNGPTWIILLSGFVGTQGTIKLDFADTRDGANVKYVLNKPVVLNNVPCRMLPWFPKQSTPMCSKCQRWGHTTS